MSEERIVLEMNMSDYGYIINTLKRIQSNALGNPDDKTSIPCEVCLNILSKSIDTGDRIDRAMVKGFAHTLTEAANDVANGNADSQTIIDILDVASSLAKHFLIYDEPEEKEAIEAPQGTWATLKTETDKPTSGRYVWSESNMPVYGPDPLKDIDILKEQYKKMTDAFYQYKNEIEAINKRLNPIEHKLSDVDINKLNARTNELYALYEQNNKSINCLDRKFSNKFEALKHTTECLIDRDHNFFDKVKELTERNNKLQMNVTELSNKIDKKEKNDKLDISSASFNIYFSKDNKEDDE